LICKTFLLDPGRFQTLSRRARFALVFSPHDVFLSRRNAFSVFPSLLVKKATLEKKRGCLPVLIIFNVFGKTRFSADSLVLDRTPFTLIVNLIALHM